VSEENRVEEPTDETAVQAEPEMPKKFQTKPEPDPLYETEVPVETEYPVETKYPVEYEPDDEEVGKPEPLTREDRQKLRRDPFQVYQDAKGEWRWRLLSPENGLILADSDEGYYSKAGAQRAVRGVKLLIRSSV
jgi:uncharacterized protein YegP (UPF0339 family)